ncbi:MAG: fructose-1,6-bisphosphatase [candidate division Zixibacteria bacterium]|nr:fructose-1,6-bisphosphatase [candidate division Zixibacteria bacterium]
MPTKEFMNVRRFLYNEQRLSPKATGEFTTLLLDIILGCKKVCREVRQFGLSQYQHTTGAINVQDEEVHELDDLANDLLLDLLTKGGQTCGVVTEENKEIVGVPASFERGKYVVTIDPLDGFSNIGVNVNIGTIFSVRKKISEGEDSNLSDFLQPGRSQVCAGYVMYGPAMVLVFTIGRGVYEFTYSLGIDEFILSRENIRMPDLLPNKKGSFSANTGYWNLWDDKAKAVSNFFMEGGYSFRHIGSFIADFHRHLLQGGIFCYPANSKSPNGKLRLLYELAPLSFIAEQAGGLAIDGSRPILDLKPDSLHQRSPVYIGSRDAVIKAMEILAAPKR